MKHSITCQNGYLKDAGEKGRGVFALRKLEKGEVIEVSPYIEIPSKDFHALTPTILDDYRFEIKGRQCAIGAGLTSFYNHSENPNASFHLNSRRRTLTIKATKTILPDEEILINYGYDIIKHLNKKKTKKKKKKS